MLVLHALRVLSAGRTFMCAQVEKLAGAAAPPAAEAAGEAKNVDEDRLFSWVTDEVIVSSQLSVPAVPMFCVRAWFATHMHTNIEFDVQPVVGLRMQVVDEYVYDEVSAKPLDMRGGELRGVPRRRERLGVVFHYFGKLRVDDEISRRDDEAFASCVEGEIEATKASLVGDLLARSAMRGEHRVDREEPVTDIASWLDRALATEGRGSAESRVE